MSISTSKDDKEPSVQHWETGTTRDITQAEHELGFWDAVKRYPMACFWSAFFCIGVITAGFDVQLISSFFALPAFQRRYGMTTDGSDYYVSASWQTALGMGNPIGQIVGGLACGWPLERFGRRVTLAVCCVWSMGFVAIQFSAVSIQMLCIGEILGGLAIGFYAVIAPTYASEVCPLALRGVLTASTNLGFVIGQFIAQGVATAFESRQDQWAYRVPFALQWLWPLILLLGLGFAPESPYWLVRKGRKEKAKESLIRLSSSAAHTDVDGLLLLIEQTDALERELEKATTYWDCFRGRNLVRTEICSMVYIIQVIGGNPLIGWANFFFVQAGLDPADAFKMGVGNTAMGFVGTCVSWWLLNLYGRRTIYNTGMAIMTIILFVIGFLDFGAGQSGAVWAQASLMNVWTFLYQMTVGPICFVIISEVSSTRLRGRTIAVATALQALSSIVFTVVMPYMLGSHEANWRGKAGYLFGGISFVCLIWCHFRLPETRGRTFEEIDLLFEERGRLRDFAKRDLLTDVLSA